VEAGGTAADASERAVLLVCGADVARLAAVFPSLAAGLTGCGGCGDGEAATSGGATTTGGGCGCDGQANRFGENVRLGIGSLSAATACIGDVLHVVRGGGGGGGGPEKRALEFEVSGPRRPCSSIDAVHPSGFFDLRGVRGTASLDGSTGFFARVRRRHRASSPPSSSSSSSPSLSPPEPEEPLELAEGDAVVVALRPHPGWTVARVARVVYGGSDGSAAYRFPAGGAVPWTPPVSARAAAQPPAQPPARRTLPCTRAELAHCAEGLPALALCEWRDTARGLLRRVDAGELAVLPPQCGGE